MRSDEALLLDMLLAAQKIIRFMQGMSEAEFRANELVQSAILREFQVLGEAARMLSGEAKKQYQQIPWQSIAGMRNRLIHEYFDVRLDVVWQTVQHDIGPLMSQLDQIELPEEDGDAED